MNTMPSLLGSLWSDQLGATDGFGSSSPFPSESKQHTVLAKIWENPTSPPQPPGLLPAVPAQAERVEVAPQLVPEEGEEEELLEDDAVVEPSDDRGAAAALTASLPVTLASLSETAELLLKEGHGDGWGWRVKLERC